MLLLSLFAFQNLGRITACPTDGSASVAAICKRIDTLRLAFTLGSHNEAYRRVLGKSLIKLASVPGSSIGKVCNELDKHSMDGRNYMAEYVICDLWFLLKYGPPNNDNNLSLKQFYVYHFPMVAPDGPITYTFPWHQGSHGWEIDPFVVRIEGGIQSLISLYGDFAHLPLRFSKQLGENVSKHASTFQ